MWIKGTVTLPVDVDDALAEWLRRARRLVGFTVSKEQALQALVELLLSERMLQGQVVTALREEGSRRARRGER